MIRDSLLVGLLDRAERARDDLARYRLTNPEAAHGYRRACAHVDAIERELQRRLLVELGR